MKSIPDYLPRGHAVSTIHRSEEVKPAIPVGDPVLALDIGGTKLATGMVTADGAVYGLRTGPTRIEEGPDAVIRRLFALGHGSIVSAGLPAPPAAVGISCGGPLDAGEGFLLSPLHLPGWNRIPIGPMAAKAFGAPFALENDATAAALGEFTFGAGRGTQTMLYLTLSTGVGGGAVIGGRLHRGAAGNGGELGHLTVRPGGRKCSCPRRGCLEAYCSGSSIAARAAEQLATGRVSSLSGPTAPTARDVAAAASEGDPLASQLWTETIGLLAEALTSLVNVFEPDLVVLGGGVANAGAMLLDPVRDLVRTQAVPPAATACRIELSARPDLCCVIGAGAIAHELTAAGGGRG